MRAQTSNPVGSAWGVFFASIFALWVGVCIASVELILRPVEVVEFTPANATPLKRVLVLGSESGGATWQEKMAAIVNHQATLLTFTEGDWNAFLRRALVAKDGAPATFTPNVRITPAGGFQLGIVAYPAFLKKKPFTFQTRGGFEKSAGGFGYRERKTYCGSLPLPHLLAQPVLDAVFWKVFSGEDAKPLVAAWQKLTDIAIDEHRLRLYWE